MGSLIKLWPVTRTAGHWLIAHPGPLRLTELRKLGDVILIELWEEIVMASGDNGLVAAPSATLSAPFNLLVAGLPITRDLIFYRVAKWYCGIRRGRDQHSFSSGRSLLVGTRELMSHSIMRTSIWKQLQPRGNPYNSDSRATFSLISRLLRPLE